MNVQYIWKALRAPNRIISPYTSYSSYARPAMTGHKRNAPKQHARKPRPEKRPPLTHFLCIPLVNSKSLPQLEASIKTFRNDYPPIPVADLPQSHHPSPNDHVSQPLIPEGAIRPLGTLHLTLGVMSLPSKERLDEALNFFHSLDLKNLMREAELIALRKRSKHTDQQYPHEATLQPLTASLEALHALPKAEAATVLHTTPVDPTDRLYPFCLMLRGKFLEAGFLVGEVKENPNKSNQNKEASEKQQASQGQYNTETQASPSQQPELDSLGTPNKLDHHGVAAACTPKLRPLLLHATIVNTIYVRGRSKPKQGPSPHAARNKKAQSRIFFDAREVLARYGNYYADEGRTRLRSKADSLAGISDAVAAQPQPRYPFVWAKDIPLDSVCICEMGAKELAVDGRDPEKNNFNKRLGEKYAVVAQRSLLDSSDRPPSSSTQSSSQGGVQLEQGLV